MQEIEKRAERARKASLRLDGVKFYSDEEWATIVNASGIWVNSIAHELAAAASTYLKSISNKLELKKERRSVKELSQVSMAAQRFLLVLSRNQVSALDSGINDIDPNEPWAVDFRKIEYKFDSMISSVTMIMKEYENRAKYIRTQNILRNKNIRRNYFRDLSTLWSRSSGLTIDSSNITKLLDFLLAATKPVLVLGDRIGTGKPGRDVLRKEMKLIQSGAKRFIVTL
jgi:hypothetical protein